MLVFAVKRSIILRLFLTDFDGSESEVLVALPDVGLAILPEYVMSMHIFVQLLVTMVSISFNLWILVNLVLRRMC